MAKLTNPSNRDISLPAGHVIPRGGELIVTNDIITGDNWPTLSGLIKSGAISVEYDAEIEPGYEPNEFTAVSVAVTTPEIAADAVDVGTATKVKAKT